MILELDGRKADVAPVSQSPELRRLANLERLQVIIEKAQEGKLPRDRDLKEWEPATLSPVHIQMILDRVSGMGVGEIAEKHSYDIGRVSVVLHHPDAQVITATILSMSADRLTDMNERLKHLAPEALNVKVELMRQAATENLRDKAATDILALAGFGARKAVEINMNDNRRQTLVLPAQAAEGLMAAMRESQLAAKADYSQHLANAAGSEEATEHKQLSDGLKHGVGHSDAESGASPASLPVAADDFTVEWDESAIAARREAEADEAESRKVRVA